MLSMQKGTPTALDNDGAPVTTFTAAIGWDSTATGKKGIAGAFARRKGADLDLVVIALDEKNRPLACCSFESPDIMGMHHSGDNTTGEGDGDDETVTVDLEKLPGQVVSVLVAATGFKGAGFDKVGSLFYRVVDTSGGQAKDLTGEVFVPIVAKKNAVTLAKVSRANGPWRIETLGDLKKVKTWRDLASR